VETGCVDELHAALFGESRTRDRCRQCEVGNSGSPQTTIVLLKMEQEGSIVSHWGVSENNRKAKFYQLTRAGRKQLEKEARDWEQTTAILARFLTGDMS
jgi:DNA-binding PadR family transcriptional regulator